MLMLTLVLTFMFKNINSLPKTQNIISAVAVCPVCSRMSYIIKYDMV